MKVRPVNEGEKCFQCLPVKTNSYLVLIRLVRNTDYSNIEIHKCVCVLVTVGNCIFVHNIETE